MSRFLALMIALASWFVPVLASAQDACPPGELCNLRTDDSRCEAGYRCFEFGSFIPGSHVSLRTMRERVNADIDDPSRHVTIEQVEASNPCGVIYHADGAHAAHNGSCSAYNGTPERVTFEEYEAEHHGAGRWPMAHYIYRVPAVPHLTPGEEAEQLAAEINAAAVTGTVPAPDWFGARHIEAHELINSGELTQAQIDALLSAFDHALGRARAASVSEEPEDDSSTTEPAQAGGETPRLPAQEVVTVTVVRPVYENPAFWIALVCAIAISLLLGFMLGNKDKKSAVITAGTEGQNKIIALQTEITRLSGIVPAATTVQMNEVEDLKQRNRDLELKLALKRADDAAEAAEIGNNRTFIENLTIRWNDFYASVDSKKVVRKLNVANIINLFSELELFVIMEKAWDEKVFGPMNRANIQKALSPHKTKRIEQLEEDLRKKGIDLTTAQVRAGELEGLNGNLTAELEASKSEQSRTVDELKQERAARIAAENKAEMQEAQLFELAGTVQSIHVDATQLFERIFEKKDGSPTWQFEAKEVLVMVQTVVDSAWTKVEPLIESLLGSTPMLLAPAGDAGPLLPEPTSITPPHRRQRVPTSPIGIERPVNGEIVVGSDRWATDPPKKPNGMRERKPTLPPEAGKGLYGPAPSLHADGIPPDSVTATVEMDAEKPNGTEDVTDPPKPDPEPPKAAPGTVDLLAEEDDALTRPS